MAISTSTVGLTHAITTRYTQKYLRAAAVRRLYDQLATPVGASQYDLETRRGLGSTYTFNFASDLTPGSTAISELVDIVPQILRDATSTITPTSRGEAIKWSQLMDLEAYTDFVAVRSEKVGENAMETIDNLAKAAALQGTLVHRGSGTTRILLDAGTAGMNWTEANLWTAATMVQDLRCPPYISPDGQRSFLAIAHPDAFYDLFHGGNVVTLAMNSANGRDILFNGELGSLAGFKLIISPWAKVFGSAGLVNATACGTTHVGYAITGCSADGSTFAAGAPSALSLGLTVTTATNVGSGRMLTIGTCETGNTHYDTNERVRWTSGTTSMLYVGSGANGGLRFDHALTDTVMNDDSVYPVVYGGPGSLVKVYANEVGEFGQLVGPLEDGLAHQWQSLAWKFFGQYGRVAENYLLRGEYSSSLDNV
jgi:N4-gp56 family major capsid protein